METTPYTIEQHIHIYATWAASRGAMTSKKHRFKVQQGQTILENAAIRKFIQNPESLPCNQNDFDTEHQEWRQEIIQKSIDHGLHFSHGVAAKLINLYLKCALVCGGYHEHQNVRFIHPPIDSVLLKALAAYNFGNQKSFWVKMNKIAWSNFSSEDYQSVITSICNGIGENEPLWKIEKFWQGHQ